MPISHSCLCCWSPHSLQGAPRHSRPFSQS
uniref:Uncharacterized protein n=1 Tax=Anguilla anguilla TaxID=7936 RepID=A0A0E9PQX1_ANGAN